MTTVSEAFVTLRPDTSGFGREAEGGVRSALAGIAKVASGIVAANVLQDAAQGVRNFVGGAVEQASALGESINAVQQVFADTAPQILDWGKSNATSFGLSQRAFNEMATPMGAVLRNLGLDQDAVADSTIDLTKRAADMASVFNTDVEDALAAINSALRGEANPIERYGVSVTAAAVAQRALADTGKTSAEALTETEKASARLAIIFEQTQAVAGDFQATSDGLANSQRVQAAETERYQALIGQKLIPVQLAWNRAKFATVQLIAERVVPALSALSAWLGERVVPVVAELGERFRRDVLPVLRDEVLPVVERFTRDVLGALVTTFRDDLQPKLEAFAGVLRDTVLPAAVTLGAFVRDGLVPPLQAFGAFLAAHKEFLVGFGVAIAAVLTPAFVAWAVAAGAAAVATVAATAPAIALTVAIAALAGGIIWTVRHWDEVTAAMGRFSAFVAGKLSDLVDWLRDRFFGFLDGRFAWLAALLGPVGLLLVAYRFRDELQDVFSAVVDWLGERLGEVGGFLDTLRAGFDGLVTFFVELPGRIAEGLGTLTERIAQPFQEAFDGVKAIINAFIGRWNSLEIPVPSVDVPLVGTLGGFTVGTPDIPAFDTGGAVPGRLGESVLALLHAGETVLPTHRLPRLDAGMPGPAPVIYQVTVHAPRYVGREDDLADEVRRALTTLQGTGRA